MKRLLIITEDVVKIQTLSKFSGRLYARIYLYWHRLRIRAIILCLSRFFQISAIVSNDLGFSGKEFYFYGDLLAKVDYAKNRKKYWETVLALTKTINLQYKKFFLKDLFLNKLTIYLAYNFLIYELVYEEIFKAIKPDLILTLGNSWHEQIAAFTGRKNNQVKQWHFLSLSWLQKLVHRFLLQREYRLKINNFFHQSQKPKKTYQPGSILLSADFYRHLKVLIPIYKKLSLRKYLPLLVTDINLLPTLNNLYSRPVALVVLPAYFPSAMQGQIRAWLQEAKKIKFCPKNNFWGKLCFEAAEPMMRQLIFLSRLYLVAGDHLFDQLLPKGLVIVSDVRLTELTLAALAKIRHVPSILVSPNTMLDLSMINPYQAADKVAVVGNYIKKQLLAIGVKEAKIKVIGDLVAENINANGHLKNKTKVYKLLGIPLEKKLALLISFRPTWMIPKEEKEAFVRLAANATQKLNNVCLVVKPHPTEKRYRVLDELAEWGIKNVVVANNNEISLLDLLFASDAVLQTWSFTVFEAIMLNRPVISVNPFKKNYNNFLPIIKLGGVVEVNRLSDLIYWLRILTDYHNEVTKKHLLIAKKASDKFIHFSHGEASSRVVQLLLDK